MQIYYITFCWERNLLYDGYIMKQDNRKIIGYTDETIIVGDENEIKEITDVGDIIYPISEYYFSKYKSNKGFRLGLKADQYEVKVNMANRRNITKEKIVFNFNKKLKTYPEEMQIVFRSYIEED